MPALITLENVSWAYSGAPGRALKGISLEIGEGECVAVMGENGAGKTSLCRLLNGLIPHSMPGTLSGAVTVCGMAASSCTVAQLAKKVGMVFDDPAAQLFTARAADEVAFALENLCCPPDEIREKVRWALEAAGLSAYADCPPSSLSGGQKQRLAIASSLAMAEKVLVLDEATSQLDPAGAQEILSLICGLCAKNGLALVMATHSRQEARQFAHKVCVLDSGSIAAFGAPEEILAERRGACHREAGAARAGVGDPVIQVSHLSFQYGGGNMVLDDVNLSIGENEFAAVGGPNGCGKTTLLKNISGLLRPSRGAVLLRGRDMAQLGIARIAAEIGFVMQEPDSQLFAPTVYDEVAFALIKRGPARGKAKLKEGVRSAVEDALSMVGLQDKKDAFPPALNRADRVKTVFAAILAMGPKIIMLDEPFAGQDEKGCHLIMEALMKLHGQGYTVVVVTHNMSLVGEYALSPVFL